MRSFRPPYLVLRQGLASPSGMVRCHPLSPDAFFIRGVHVGQIVGWELLIPEDMYSFGGRVGLDYLE